MRHLVIVGPTASGKSALAHEIARRCSVPILSADSMAVYRGMDIGTAKPTRSQRDEVEHHLIDVVSPDEEFSVAEFQRRANVVVGSHRPCVVVGGTGLYVDALVDGLTMPGRWPAVRVELETRATASLWLQLQELDPSAAEKIEPANRRRIVRALEVSIGSGRPFSSFGPGLQAMRVTESAAAGATSTSPYHLVGLRMDRQLLAARIKWRYDVQLANGFVAEVAGLRSRYGATLSRTAAQALGYREILAYLNGECSLDEAVGEAVRRTVHFAKRQERWFRRDPRIHWLDVDRLVGETPEAQAVADPSLKGNAATVQMAALADWVLADWRR